jgi:hypothetical protein
MSANRNRGIRTAPAEQAIQLKMVLQYIRPPIWRRVLVPDHYTLAHVHYVIQIAMGWTNSHLHEFEIDGERYGYAGPDEFDGEMESDANDESIVFLSRLALKPKRKFSYTYDFGDGWEHDITVEKLLPFDPQASYPVCLGGARACPPEDCGSYPGYESILHALRADPPTQGQKELLEWLGSYDPERFSVDAVNRCFQPRPRKKAARRTRA